MARGNWQAVHLVRSTRRVCCVDAGSLAALGCCVAAAEYVRGAWVSCCRETRRACLSRIIDKCSRATRFVPPPVRWWGGTQGKRGRRAAREMRPRKARVCIAPADAACGRPHRVQLRDQKGRLPARLTRLSTRRARVERSACVSCRSRDACARADVGRRGQSAEGPRDDNGDGPYPAHAETSPSAGFAGLKLITYIPDAPYALARCVHLDQRECRWGYEGVEPCCLGDARGAGACMRTERARGLALGSPYPRKEARRRGVVHVLSGGELATSRSRACGGCADTERLWSAGKVKEHLARMSELSRARSLPR